MPDKSQADPSTRPKGTTAKLPIRDYSTLPQKPIKLKDEIDLHPALKSAETEHKSAQATPPLAKPRRKKPTIPKTPAPKTPTLIDSLSPEAREILQRAASTSGLEPLAWLDQLVRQSPQTDHRPPTSDNRELLQMLHKIDERLLRLEDQRGFWSRFWDQFMNPPGRTGDSQD